MAAIEAQRAEALSRHLAGIAPGLNATNDQVIDYMGKSAQARARLGEVMSPDQPQAGAAVTSAGAHVTTANTGKAAQASTAGVNQATAKHLGAQTAGLQQDQDTTTALGTPADKRTEAQNVLAAAAEAKLAAKQNTPEKLSAARKSAETYTEKIMRAGKGAMDSFSPEEMANMRATMMASGELAALAQASGAGRNIDESSNHNAALKAVAEGRVLLQTGAVSGSLEEATMAAIRRSGGAAKRGPADGLSPPAAGASAPAAAGVGARGGANTNYSHFYR